MELEAFLHISKPAIRTVSDKLLSMNMMLFSFFRLCAVLIIMFAHL